MKQARKRAPWLLLGLLGWALGAAAEEVTVIQVDSDGQALAKATYASTDAVFTSVEAPQREGLRFVRWEIAPAHDAFVYRDGWGRALDAVSFTPIDKETTLTAVYLPASQDEDGDGLSDGDERYWYDTLGYGPTDDTDGDGYTLAQELQYGLNPLFPDAPTLGAIAWEESATLLYNPNGYVPYTLRSEPEGALFETATHYVSTGTSVTSEAYSPTNTPFAYWTVNGVRQEDAFGRALERITFTMAGEPIEAVAHCIEDEPTRQMVYWFGREVSPEEDGDGDGYTFAQELQYGLNPLFKDTLTLGGIAWGDSALLIYNPNSYTRYTIQADPAETFAPQSGLLHPGEPLDTPSFATDATFAYWDLNGVRQADAFGRALDSLVLVGPEALGEAQIATAHFLPEAADAETRALAYWYGDRPGLSLESDTDGDGYSLAQELQFGLNPLFPDTLVPGGHIWSDSPLQETNLQPFDLASKLLLGGALTELFAGQDPLTGALTGGHPFGEAIAPAILDCDGNGLFDLLVAGKHQLWRYLNRGQIGAPDFEATDAAALYPQLAQRLATFERPRLCGGSWQDQPALWLCDGGGPIFRYTPADDTLTETGHTGWPVWSEAEGWGFFDGATLHLGTLTLACDSLPEGVSSAALLEATGDTVPDLLVADAQGRICLYQRTDTGLALKHRVWGGTYAGFAQGLALAPVDWEGDGDGDMLAGTATGHLLLLTDPGVGRPTNLRATAGYNNVLLAWDPNAQSRVCGYTVYRAAPEADFAALASVPLPTYRDFPPETATWLYRVTTLSRLWRAGNSTPETFESAPSEVCSASLGSVTLSLPDGDGFLGQSVELPLAIDNAAGLRAQGLSLTLAYDPACLEPETFVPSALCAQLLLTEARDTAPDGTSATWTLSADGGTLVPGSGELFRLRFKAIAPAPCETALALSHAALCSALGQSVTVHRPTQAACIRLTRQVNPVTVTLAAQDEVAEDGSLVLTLSALPDGALDWESLAIAPAYDSTFLTLTEALPPSAEADGRYTFILSEAAYAQRAVEVSFSGTATGADGEAARVEPATCRVLIPTEGDESEGEGEGMNRPGWRPIVSLNAALAETAHEGPRDYTVLEGESFTVAIHIWRLGRLDWSSLVIEPHFAAEELERLSQGDEPLGDSPETRLRTFSFRVLAPEGWHRNLALRFTGTARGTNGSQAIVWPAALTLHVAERPHPDVVNPWTNGDCDGDGRLTGNDYQVAFKTVKRYHPQGGGKKAPQHTEEALRIHRSLCQAIGKAPEAELELADVTTSFKKYLWERGVTDTNMGNANPGGKP